MDNREKNDPPKWMQDVKIVLDSLLIGAFAMLGLVLLLPILMWVLSTPVLIFIAALLFAFICWSFVATWKKVRGKNKDGLSADDL